MTTPSKKKVTDSLSALGQRTEPPPISWLMSEALKQPDLISLAAGFTDNKTLPVAATRRLTELILRKSEAGRQSLQYGVGEGNENLRHHTSEQLARLDAEFDQPSKIQLDQIVITNGSQQFLYLLSEILCDPGDIVIVEDPTYFVYLSIMQSHGLQARTAPMTPEGISLSGLEDTLKMLKQTGEIKRLKFVYAVTYFQNPTGLTTTLENKKAVLDLLRQYESAAGHRLYYVEDAAYRELNFPSYTAPKSSLSLKDYRDRIVYTGTYSKSFATGIRVGFGVLPENLYKPLMNVKGNHDFGTAHFLQMIVAAAISLGDYEKQLISSRKRYAKKCRTMLRAIEEYFPEAVRSSVPQGGLCLWASLPKRVTTGPKSRFFKESLDTGVLYVPGEFAFADDVTRKKPRSSMRLSFGSASEEKIEKGIMRLAHVMKQRLE